MSTLRTNALEGVDAKNSITIVAGAGNITTSNVQDGLAMMFGKAGGDAVVAKSLNISSSTDQGTGNYLYAFTSVFSDDDYATVANAGSSAARMCVFNGALTTSIDIKTFNSSGSATNLSHGFNVHGDLA